MARYRGLIGYIREEETSPDVFEPVIVEKTHSGEILKESSRYERGSSESTNDNLSITNRISIVADDIEHDLSTMKYATLFGKKWKIVSFEVQRPRVILQLGGLYNG